MARGRIYPIGKSFQVVWQWSRCVATREEAERLARLEYLPPPKNPARGLVADEVAERVRDLRRRGLTYASIARLLEQDGIRPPRSSTWSHGTLRKLVEARS